MSRPPARLARRVATGLFVAVTASVALTATTVESAGAATWNPSAYSARLVQLVNGARADHGLRVLTVASGTTSVAVAWTRHLAADRALSHNPRLWSDLVRHGSPHLRKGAENVAKGVPTSPDAMFMAYMKSPSHRANILDRDLSYVGSAVVFSGYYAWNTMDFADQYGSSRATTSYKTRFASSATRTTVRRPSASVPTVTSKPKPAGAVSRTTKQSQRSVATPRTAVARVSAPTDTSTTGAGTPFVAAGALLLLLGLGHCHRVVWRRRVANAR